MLLFAALVAALESGALLGRHFDPLTVTPRETAGLVAPPLVVLADWLMAGADGTARREPRGGRRRLLGHAHRRDENDVAASTLGGASVRAEPPSGAEASPAAAAAARPNVLLYLAADLGYADPSVFARHAIGRSLPAQPTPHLAQLSRDGLMLTHYLTEAHSTPARAALLTGRYPARYGLAGGEAGPQRSQWATGAPAGLRRSEATLAAILRAAGYETGFSGVWELGVGAADGADDGAAARADADVARGGELAELFARAREARRGGGDGDGVREPRGARNLTFALLPAQHGFDTSLVLPLAHNGLCDPRPAPCGTDGCARARGAGRAQPPAGYARSAAWCPLIANSTIVQQPTYMHGLAANLREHALRSIQAAAAHRRPWLHVFADPHPAAPQFAAHGAPDGTRFGAALAELDETLGALLAEIDALGQAESTLVVFAAVSGPALESGRAESGHTGGLRGGKGQVWEGGLRVPAIVRWRGLVPAATVSDAPVRSLDWLPTIISLARAPVPAARAALRALDGVDQSRFLRTAVAAFNPWLIGPDGLGATRAQLHFCGARVIGARVRNIKILWATQRWAQPDDLPGGPRGGWAPDVCEQCCPRAGWAERAPFGAQSGCGCDDSSLDWHNPPLAFDVAADRNETRPLGAGALYDEAVALAIAERARVERELARIGDDAPPAPCLTCLVPLPLSAWPCCGGRSGRGDPRCGETRGVELQRILGGGSLPAQADALARLVHDCTAADDLAFSLAQIMRPRAAAAPAGGEVGDGRGEDGLDLARPCTCNLCAPGTAEGRGACAGGWR